MPSTRDFGFMYREIAPYIKGLFFPGDLVIVYRRSDSGKDCSGRYLSLCPTPRLLQNQKLCFKPLKILKYLTLCVTCTTVPPVKQATLPQEVNYFPVLCQQYLVSLPAQMERL